jgi:threonine/homoserine/homoserine lactone efflux protein
MTTIQAFLAFIAAASILTITPGVDTAIVLRSAATQGPRPAVFASLGIALGCLIWGAVVSVGMGALLAAFPVAFTVVKWAGAAYLIWLGGKLLLRPRDRLDVGDEAGPVDQWQSLKLGFYTNLLNPKVGVFYLTFLPQFTPTGASVAVFSFILAAVHVLLTLVWFAILIAATVPMGRLLRRPRAVRTMDRVAGGVFVAFGAKLALSR